MVNYSNGKIYRIECLTTGLIYVGSTTKQYLSQRMVEHKSGYDRYKIGKKRYVSSFKILENDNYRIDLLENVNCNTADELHAREGYYIKTLDCVNKQIAGRTLQEYYQDNKEIYCEKWKQYRDANKEQITEKLKKKDRCECGAECSMRNKSRHFKTIKHQTFLNNQI